MITRCFLIVLSLVLIDCRGTGFEKVFGPENVPRNDEGYLFALVPQKLDTIQIKLNFNFLNLHQPDEHGRCISESLHISGYDPTVKVPVLCGDITGQHVYLPVKPTKEPIGVLIRSKDTSDWSIEAIEIGENSDRTGGPAPSGCLQYYDNSTGEAMSFNYPGQHLASMEYNICLKGPAPCEVIWEEDTGVIDVGPTVAIPFESGCVYADKLTDTNGEIHYNDQTAAATTLCGSKDQFPNMTEYGTEVVPALSVYFNEDEEEELAQADPSLGRSGFKLSYTNSCA